MNPLVAMKIAKAVVDLKKKGGDTGIVDSILGNAGIDLKQAGDIASILGDDDDTDTDNKLDSKKSGKAYKVPRREQFFLDVLMPGIGDILKGTGTASGIYSGMLSAALAANANNDKGSYGMVKNPSERAAAVAAPAIAAKGGINAMIGNTFGNRFQVLANQLRTDADRERLLNSDGISRFTNGQLDAFTSLERSRREGR